MFAKYESRFSSWSAIAIMSIIALIAEYISEEVIPVTNSILAYLFFFCLGAVTIFLLDDKNVFKAGIPAVIVSFIYAASFSLDLWEDFFAMGVPSFLLTVLGAFLFKKIREEQKNRQQENPPERAKRPEGAKPWKVSNEPQEDENGNLVKTFSQSVEQKIEIDRDKYNDAIAKLEENNIRLSDLSQEEQNEFWQDVSVDKS